MAAFQLPKLDAAEERLDQLFGAFSSGHPALQDWVAIKFALKAMRSPVFREPIVHKDSHPHPEGGYHVFWNDNFCAAGTIFVPGIRELPKKKRFIAIHFED